MLVGTLFSCSPTRNLSKGENLLVANKIVFKDKHERKHLSEDDMSGVIRQKPNRKILGLYRFHLQAYNVVSPQKLEEKNQKKKARIDKRNTRRIAKGKDTLEYKPHWLDWLRNTVGEPPVILDTVSTQKSTDQLEKYLFNKGFFLNEVDYDVQYRHKFGYIFKKLFHDSLPDSVEVNARTQKVVIHYNIRTRSLYTINKFQFTIDDLLLLDDVKKSVKSSLIIKGAPYDVDKIEAERDRLTSSMRNKGYYQFQKQFIYFEVDSSLNKHAVNIKEIITNPASENEADSVKIHHKKFRIRNVYVNTSYDPKSSFVGADTLYALDMYFLNFELLRYRPELISDNVFIKAGRYYNEQAENYTYTRLAGLKNFKFINIDFEVIQGAGNDTLGYLDCTIRLTPSDRQSLAFETEGTNRSSNLGISGNVAYKNKNIFRGAERFEVRLRGGLEAQQTSNVSVSSDDANQTVSEALPFNTLEYGGELSLYIPELVFPKKVYNSFRLPRYNEPRTNLNFNYSFQQRPDYTRTISNTYISYLFSLTTKNRNNFIFNPFDISFIRIDKSTAFQERLDEINNSFLSASYNDQLITATKFSHIWSNERQLRSNSTSIMTNLELSGNILSTIYDVTNQPKTNGEYYELMGNRFSQYTRIDSDIRIKKFLTKKTRVIYRFFGGIGIPYGNSEVLPFVKSYFGGGSNDIRAWQARTLGPGSVPDSLDQGIDQIGDILIEANVEYRFPIVDFVEGAAFIDGGNIWLLNEDEQRPGGKFEFDRFYKEIALGAGVGLRFDFSFLLIRIDGAFQIHDPGLIEGERWIFEPKDIYYQTHGRAYRPTFNLNLGINYPF